MGAKDADRLHAVSNFHSGLPPGSVSTKHRPEVFLSVAFLTRTTGSFCPRLCGDRGAFGLQSENPGAETRGLRRQLGALGRPRRRDTGGARPDLGHPRPRGLPLHPAPTRG